MIKSHKRGHPILWVDGKWVFEDTRKPIADNRKCIRCGKFPTKEGYDACLGHVKGVVSACCGHGREEPYEVKG